jgi:hypothetical protein
MTPEGEEVVEIPNAKYEFAREAPLHVRKAFDGIPPKTLLREGATLYRYVEGELNRPELELWLPSETYHHLWHAEVPAWAIWKNGSFPPQFPTGFWMATLTTKIYAFKGAAAAAGKAVSWRSFVNGGLVWIPGFLPEQFDLRVFQIAFRP